jgi:hypothetical protein
MATKKLKNGVLKDWQDPAPNADGSRKAPQDVIPFRGFVNVALTAEEKEDFTEWAAKQDLTELLADVCAANTNISLKVDEKNSCFACAATSRAVDSPNAGLCVNMRGGDPMTALWRLVYVLYEILPGDWEALNAMRTGDVW